MKKRHDVDELAKQLTTAAATPLHKSTPVAAPPPEIIDPPVPSAQKKKQKSDAIPVFLRLPAVMYKHYDDIAIARTKETGRGVSVQQVIIEQLESVQ
ncbi:hypothetical protein KFZ76_22285 [Methylovulum psychrotolerans]|jgi:hypothetical protein|uniref:hypothetical protein n=1 Tax=Methylovulum psychrotolerans TaxID=1704499 RepID=UPI001BFF634E|nr:hypothetical protein [Methylovulum psychrotolerans]MBT9100430.1 hypothetical protein [Methylovulum psychrotolerans]